MSITEVYEGLRVAAGSVYVPGEGEPEEALQDVLNVVRPDHGVQVPVQLRQQKELPLLEQSAH